MKKETRVSVFSESSSRSFRKQRNREREKDKKCNIMPVANEKTTRDEASRERVAMMSVSFFSDI